MSHLWAFSSIFVLFLFSYQYKHTWWVFKKYDPTLQLGGVLIGYLIYFLIHHRASINFNKQLLAFSCFSVWVLASFFWGMLTPYAFAKSVRFLVYGVPAFFVATLIIGSSPERLEKFITAFLIFFVVILSCTLYMYFQVPKLLQHILLPELFGTNYLVTGQTLGLGVVILGAFLCHYHDSVGVQKNFFWIGVGILITLFLQMHIGGRGPLLNTLLVLGGLTLVFFKARPKKLLFIITICIAIAGLSLWALQFLDQRHLPLSLQRIFSKEGLESVALRLGYYQSALQCIYNHSLIGVGIGGWPQYYGLGNIEWHPHNIFLEIAAETGLVGLVLFGVFLFMILQAVCKRQAHTYQETVVWSGLAFCFLNALKSGDINDNIVFFTFLGFAAGLNKKGSDQHSLLKNQKIFY